MRQMERERRGGDKRGGERDREGMGVNVRLKKAWRERKSNKGGEDKVCGLEGKGGEGRERRWWGKE